MRLVADLATILSAMSVVLGYMWRKHRLQKPSNLEHMRDLEAENKEMDEILKKIGANDVQHSNRGDGNGREDRHRDGPQRRGVRRSEGDH